MATFYKVQGALMGELSSLQVVNQKVNEQAIRFMPRNKPPQSKETNNSTKSTSLKTNKYCCTHLLFLF